MLAEGNSEPQVCAFTLLGVMQRELAFRRSKGMDPDVYDMPSEEAASYLDEAARDALDYWEPRVDAGEVVFDYGEEVDGDGERLYVDIVTLGEDGDDEAEGEFEDELDEDKDW